MLQRSADALKVFSAGCLVYFVMAACSATDHSGTGPMSGPTTGNDAATGGSSGTPSSSGDVVPSAMADEAYTSGSRLKVRYYQGSDGAKQFMTWYDSSRAEECSFRSMDDAVIRCVPAVAGSSYFSDGNCSVPLGNENKGSPATKYIEKSGHIFVNAGAFGGQVFGGTPSSCSLVTPYVTAFDFYTIGAEVPVTSFVDATVKTSP